MSKTILSPELVNALRRHSNDTRNIITKLLADFDEPKLISLLDNPEYTKTSEIYAALYRLLLAKGLSIPDVHRFFIAKIGYTRQPGIFPPADRARLRLLPIYLNTYVVIEETDPLSDSSEQIMIPKGQRGVIDLSIVRWKSMRVSFSRNEVKSVPRAAVTCRFQLADTVYEVALDWEDIEPVLD